MDTAFGPADHPDLPLGLRRHPRFAMRFVSAAPDVEILAVYAHDRETLDILRPCLPVRSPVEIEIWNGEHWAAVE